MDIALAGLEHLRIESGYEYVQVVISQAAVLFLFRVQHERFDIFHRHLQFPPPVFIHESTQGVPEKKPDSARPRLVDQFDVLAQIKAV
jgi:hypothetical protein